jgi:hypothetical protein
VSCFIFGEETGPTEDIEDVQLLVVEEEEEAEAEETEEVDGAVTKVGPSTVARNAASERSRR